MTTENPMPTFYFGCRNSESGHYLTSNPGLSWQERAKRCPFREGELDGGRFLPHAEKRGKYDWPNGHRDSGRYEVQSACRITHERGWTVMSMWDRSQDQRYNSNASFLVEGTHDFATMVALARRAFPVICARIEGAAPFILAVTP